MLVFAGFHSRDGFLGERSDSAKYHFKGEAGADVSQQ